MSFGFSGVIREGAWRAFRTFVMQEFRDVPKRLAVIDAELDRIGRIFVVYETEERQTGQFRATESRKGFTVTPNSSLSKLLQSYVAVGGNPFDISMFSVPDETVMVTINGEQVMVESSPYGGISVPRGTDPAENGPYDSGFLPNLKYLPARLGGRQVAWNTMYELVDAMNRMRGWVRPEIREKRNNIEARIIKLCDLREQLLVERNEWIAGAVGNSVQGTSFIDQYQAQSARVQSLMFAIDAHFYRKEDDGRLNPDTTQIEGRLFSRFRSLLNNFEQEKWSAL